MTPLLCKMEERAEWIKWLVNNYDDGDDDDGDDDDDDDDDVVLWEPYMDMPLQIKLIIFLFRFFFKHIFCSLNSCLKLMQDSQIIWF